MNAYHVVLKHVGDGERWAEWHGDVPWSYAEAHDVLIGIERLWPRLHNPGVRFYLAAEPMWRSREAHKSAVVAALLEA
jgi:hypothetical protein